MTLKSQIQFYKATPDLNLVELFRRGTTFHAGYIFGNDGSSLFSWGSSIALGKGDGSLANTPINDWRICAQTTGSEPLPLF